MIEKATIMVASKGNLLIKGNEFRHMIKDSSKYVYSCADKNRCISIPRLKSRGYK